MHDDSAELCLVTPPKAVVYQVLIKIDDLMSASTKPFGNMAYRINDSCKAA
jgi:hypothetical protein